jgi:hypothetical protein
MFAVEHNPSPVTQVPAVMNEYILTNHIAATKNIQSESSR